MPLPANIGNLPNKIFCNLSLNRQIVLFGVLRSRIFCRLAEEQDWPEQRPVHRLVARRIQDTVERVRELGSSILAQEWSVELGVKYESAAAERRLRAELLQHQLFYGVVENSKSGADTGLARASEQFTQEAIPGGRTPRYANSWSE